MKFFIKKLLRESLLGEEDYYDVKLPDDVKRLSHRYEGRNVVWYGDPDQMIVIHKDQVEGMWGNVYNPEKLQFVVDMINNSDEKVEFECSYGIGDVITLTDIVEEQTSNIEGSFNIDYDGKERPATTGNDELDIYLGTENLDEFDGLADYVSDSDVFDVFNQNKIFIALGKVSVEELKREYFEITDDEEGLNKFLEYENMVKYANENKSGDLGKFMVQLRDGHHRVMGSIKAGEDYVCVNIPKEQIEKFKGYYKKV
jgi:hypothetical protein